MTLGERLVLTIIHEELRWRGCIHLEDLAERLEAYIGEKERKQVLADAVMLGAEPGCDLEAAFLRLLPIDPIITADERGLTLGWHGQLTH